MYTNGQSNGLIASHCLVLLGSHVNMLMAKLGSGGGEARIDHYSIFISSPSYKFFSLLLQKSLSLLFCFVNINDVARFGSDVLSFLLWQVLFTCFEQRPGSESGLSENCLESQVGLEQVLGQSVEIPGEPEKAGAWTFQFV